MRKGSEFEKVVAIFLEGRIVPMSGAGSTPGDVETEDYLVQCKDTEADSISIRKRDWEKTVKEAYSRLKRPAMFVCINGTPLAVISMHEFKDRIERNHEEK